MLTIYYRIFDDLMREGEWNANEGDQHQVAFHNPTTELTANQSTLENSNAIPITHHRYEIA